LVVLAEVMGVSMNKIPYNEDDRAYYEWLAEVMADVMTEKMESDYE